MADTSPSLINPHLASPLIRGRKGNTDFSHHPLGKALDNRCHQKYTCSMQVNNGLQIYQALSELARRYQFRNRDEVCCYGLTVSQCYALEALADSGKMPSSDLATRLGLDLSSTTRLVDQLVRKKLAVRSKSAEDARIREIEITDSGKRLVSRIQQDLIAIVNQALTDFPGDVQKALPEVLRRLSRALGECSPASKTFIPVEAITRTKR